MNDIRMAWIDEDGSLRPINNCTAPTFPHVLSSTPEGFEKPVFDKSQFEASWEFEAEPASEAVRLMVDAAVRAEAARGEALAKTAQALGYGLGIVHRDYHRDYVISPILPAGEVTSFLSWDAFDAYLARGGHR